MFEAVADGGIFVDMIVQSYGRDGKANLSFTVPQADLTSSAASCSNKLAEQLGCGPVTGSRRRSPSSRSRASACAATPAWPSALFRSLAEAGINVDMISTSEVRVNVVVDGGHGAEGAGLPAKGVCRRAAVTLPLAESIQP